MLALIMLLFLGATFWSGLRRKPWVWLVATALWAGLYIYGDTKTPDSNDTKGLATAIGIGGAIVLTGVFLVGLLAGTMRKGGREP